MPAKIFWDHLTPYQELVSQLDEFVIDPLERQEMAELIDEIFHHQLLNLILSHLPAAHHQEFMTRLHHNPSDPEILVFVKSHITLDIELEIQKTSAQLKKDITTEIQKAKKK